MSEEYVNNGHVLYWVVENGEVVESSVTHPPGCISEHSDEGHDFTYPDSRKCDLAFEEEYEPIGEMNISYEAKAPWVDCKDGAYEVNIEFHYRYFKPSYPDYEADSEFWWRPIGEIRIVV